MKKVVILTSIIVIFPIFFLYSEKLISQIDTLEYLNWNFLLPRVKDFRPGGYGSFVWRIIYWLKIYYAFIEEPINKLFFGVGIDALTKGNMPYVFMNKDPHNDFVKILVEFGFFGLFLFILFLKNIFFLIGRNINIIIIFLVPLVFDNAIVNFSFIIIITTLIAYEYKNNIEKSN